MKMVFFNGGWMSLYRGVTSDSIVNGGSHISEAGFGGEVYNFQNSSGKYYGYVVTQSGTLNLQRIDINCNENADFIDDAICIFTATHPKGGRKIVGWHYNAKIHKEYQFYNSDDRNIIDNLNNWQSGSNQVGFYSETENSVLLPVDERLSAPKIPTGKGGFGQSNIWYADSDIGADFKENVYRFILEYSTIQGENKGIELNRANQSKTNIAAKKMVEEAAISCVVKYYKQLGYSCKSVEKDNKGWDLEVNNGSLKLLIEVKGLSQAYISIMLSRNEYENMHQYKSQFRIAVVTNCLSENFTMAINIFSHISENDKWIDQYGNKLIIEEIVSARCVIE